MTTNPYDELEGDQDELPAPPRQQIPAADRELLELAARALGATFEEVDGEGYGNLHFADGSVVYGWNSLLFSGDAFELGVTLRLFEDDPDFLYKFAEEENLTADRAVAARRAATRAAAEIGRAAQA